MYAGINRRLQLATSWTIKHHEPEHSSRSNLIQNSINRWKPPDSKPHIHYANNLCLLSFRSWIEGISLLLGTPVYRRETLPMLIALGFPLPDQEWATFVHVSAWGSRRLAWELRLCRLCDCVLNISHERAEDIRKFSGTRGWMRNSRVFESMTESRLSLTGPDVPKPDRPSSRGQIKEGYLEFPRVSYLGPSQTSRQDLVLRWYGTLHSINTLNTPLHSGILIKHGPILFTKLYRVIWIIPGREWYDLNKWYHRAFSTKYTANNRPPSSQLLFPSWIK